MDWQNLIRRLAPLRTRWDVALLANLAGRDGPVRPVDLINAVNAQSDDGQLSWKVMEDRLRHLGHPATSPAGRCRTAPARAGTGCFPPGIAC